MTASGALLPHTAGEFAKSLFELVQRHVFQIDSGGKIHLDQTLNDLGWA